MEIQIEKEGSKYVNLITINPRYVKLIEPIADIEGKTDLYMLWIEGRKEGLVIGTYFKQEIDKTLEKLNL